MKQYLAREDLSDPSAEEAIIGRGHGLGGGQTNFLGQMSLHLRVKQIFPPLGVGGTLLEVKKAR